MWMRGGRRVPWEEAADLETWGTPSEWCSLAGLRPLVPAHGQPPHCLYLPLIPGRPTPPCSQPPQKGLQSLYSLMNNSGPSISPTATFFLSFLSPQPDPNPLLSLLLPVFTVFPASIELSLPYFTRF